MIDQFLFYTSSVPCIGQDARQRDGFWKDSREEVDNELMLSNLDATFVCTSGASNNRLVRKKLKSMWGIAWGIKIKTSVFKRVEIH